MSSLRLRNWAAADVTHPRQHPRQSRASLPEAWQRRRQQREWRHRSGEHRLATNDDAATLRVEYRANSVIRAHDSLYKKIRDSAAGREAIGGLLDDPVTAVRVLAATHSLTGEPGRAARGSSAARNWPRGGDSQAAVRVGSGGSQRCAG